MREDPGLDVDKIVAPLEAHYGLRVTSVTFLPIGYDPNAAVYQIVSRDVTAYFLKVRFGSVEPSAPGLRRTPLPRTRVNRG